MLEELQDSFTEYELDTEWHRQNIVIVLRQFLQVRCMAVLAVTALFVIY